MSERITVGDVENVAQTYARMCDQLGLTPDGNALELQHGNQSAGRAWRVFAAGGHAAPGTGDRGYIGWTTREAYGTLWTIVRTLEAVSIARKSG